jgi:hypothetical protein
MNEFVLFLEAFRPLFIFIAIYIVARFSIQGAADASMLETITARRLTFIVNLVALVIGLIFVLNKVAHFGTSKG